MGGVYLHVQLTTNTLYILFLPFSSSFCSGRGQRARAPPRQADVFFPFPFFPLPLPQAGHGTPRSTCGRGVCVRPQVRARSCRCSSTQHRQSRHRVCAGPTTPPWPRRRRRGGLMSARAGGSVRSTCVEPRGGREDGRGREGGGRDTLSLVCHPATRNLHTTPTHAVRRMTTCYVHPPDTPRDW